MPEGTLPHEAEVVEWRRESPTLFTLRLRFTDAGWRQRYRFAPGQFNMLYLYGVGEVPISIVSDPYDPEVLDHTIRGLGRVTRGLEGLRPGDWVGIRGPFGTGWPLRAAEQRDLVVVTGGLGCAPVVGAINYVMRRRERFGRINIVQGVKHSDDLIWKERYAEWARAPDTRVFIAADRAGPIWPWHVGRVTDLFDDLRFDARRVLAMLCGPEGMMRVVIDYLLGQEVAAGDIWLSMERNMQCGIGLCGHCQVGPHFVCRDGPVFPYARVRPWFHQRGF